MEVYTAVFEVMGDDCELEWVSPVELTKDAIPMKMHDTAPTVFLCATQYPAYQWLVGW